MTNDADIRALTRTIKDLSTNVKSLEKAVRQKSGRPIITNHPPKPSEHQHIEGIMALGTDGFVNEDKSVINYEGSNYYRACGAFVKDLPEGAMSWCVKRSGHPNALHEDYDGNIRGPGVGE